MRTGPLVDGLINHLVDGLGEPREVLTSLDRLATATNQDTDNLRLALAELVKAGDAAVQRGREPTDTERLEAHQDRVLCGEAVMGRGTWSWIVPDGLWEIAKPLIPPSRVRPQGSGTQDMPDETLFAAIIYVLVSGCAWRALPPCFGVSKSTAHRRFLIWSRAGVWGRLHEEILHRLDDAGLLDLSRAVLDSARIRAK